MFIIYIIDLSTKNKTEKGGFKFLNKSKIQTVKPREKMSNYFILEIPNFAYMRFFQKMLYVSPKHSFKSKFI